VRKWQKSNLTTEGHLTTTTAPIVLMVESVDTTFVVLGKCWKIFEKRVECVHERERFFADGREWDAPLAYMRLYY